VTPDAAAPSVAPFAPMQTARLTLVPATAEHVRAELASRAELAAMLGAEVPASWPPGEYDRGAQEYFLARLEEGGDALVGWLGWYAVRHADDAAPATVVGAGGYFGPPDDDGGVEIGYSMTPEWRGRGYARELVAALVAHAAALPGVRRVVAHTTDANPASIAVLERAGFVRDGVGAEPGSVRFVHAPAR
jgi:ribosomal-protein-alanine N-acetyltransferase